MKRNKARPETKTENGWPRLVKVGGTVVRVYRQTRANGTPGYYVADYSTGVRRMRSFPTEETALVEAKLLAAAPADFVPLLAIGAFAGVRVAEILRLDWGNVDLAGGFITVAADKAKTARRRLVPLSDNLRQWLAPYAQPEGKLWNLSDCMFSERSAATAAKARVDWKANGLRHSFISYRVAQVQNVAQVALEAGNSAQVIFSNYRELVRPADAVKWFAIAPEAPGNVVSLNQAVA